MKNLVRFLNESEEFRLPPQTMKLLDEKGLKDIKLLKDKKGYKIASDNKKLKRKIKDLKSSRINVDDFNDITQEKWAEKIGELFEN